MTDYTKYSIEDFASNESFVDWVYQSDPEAIKFWALYISEHPEILQKVEEARVFVLNLKKTEEIEFSDDQIASILKNVNDKIDRKARGHKTRSFGKLMLVAASSITLAVASFAVLYILNKTNVVNTTSASSAEYQNGLTDYVEQVNETGKILEIQLSDGTRISLENKSRLKYKANFVGDSAREVYLLGEAFFDVARDPHKPFRVHSNEIITEVLGTSFRVKALEESDVTVSVRTGRVSVYASQEKQTDVNKDGVILMPNEQVTYERDQQVFDKMLVSKPEVLRDELKEKDFNFENAPIGDVFAKLEDAYGIEIVFSDETMKNCFITAPLGSEPLFEKLKIICQTIGARYEIIETRVVISSSGC
jgi:transmembrane sensor